MNVALSGGDAPRDRPAVEVGVRELRDNLSRFLDLVEKGTEVTVTNHGKAVARLSPIEHESLLDRLIAEGLVTPPKHKGPRTLPKKVRARGTVSDIVLEHRGR